MNPKITAAIRTYNRSSLLPKAIESVLEQTFTDFELIVLDDCSTDSTEEVVKSYLVKDSRIRYIKQKENSGTGAGFNRINSEAKGKYIAYLDDDDTWRSKKLELQFNLFEKSNNKVGIITGYVQQWNAEEKKKIKIWKPLKTGYLFPECLTNSGKYFGPPSVVMIKKSILDHIGLFDENLKRGTCQHYFRRLSKKYSLACVEEVCIDYYFHKKAITAINGPDDIKKSIDSLEYIIKNLKIDFLNHKKPFANELLKLGDLYIRYNNFKKARKIFLKSIKNNPFVIKSYLMFLSSFFGKKYYNHLKSIMLKFKNKYK